MSTPNPQQQPKVYPVAITRLLDEQFMYDVMITAVESGMQSVWYWSGHTAIERDDESNVTAISMSLEEDAPSPTNTVGGTLNEGSMVRVNADDIHRAIITILGPQPIVGPLVTGYVRDAVVELDCGNIDSDAADCIVQIAVFGEVVYG